jgi:hypothetical protein
LQYVKNQTEEICKLDVQQNGLALRYVKNQTEEICKLSVNKTPNALYYVPEHMKHLYYKKCYYNNIFNFYYKKYLIILVL